MHYCSYPICQRHRAIYGLLSSSATSAHVQQIHIMSTTAHTSSDAGCMTDPLFPDDAVMVITVIVAYMNFYILY